MPCLLDACQARQPQVGGAGNEAFLAGRQIEVGAGLGDHAVHDTEQLTAAADGEGINHREPRFLDNVLELIAAAVGIAVAAINLVKQAKLALHDEFDEGYLAVVEMREVDPGIENALAGIFRVLQQPAAQHADLDAVIEQHEIDRRLHCSHGAIVLGIEEGAVAVRDGADITLRSTVVSPMATRPVRLNSGNSSSASRFGRSMAWTRCMPQRSSASTCAMKTP